MSPREGVEVREGGAVEGARLHVSGERQGGEEAEEEFEKRLEREMEMADKYKK